ncbi:MAG: hypothetical protein WDO18_21545 [Acidobacteriota bacterium]
MARLYDATNGSVFLNGRNIQSIQPKSAREKSDSSRRSHSSSPAPCMKISSTVTMFSPVSPPPK